MSSLASAVPLVYDIDRRYGKALWIVCLEIGLIPMDLKMFISNESSLRPRSIDTLTRCLL